MQKAQLFAGTIRSNLLWGNSEATDEELWAFAAQLLKAESESGTLFGIPLD